MSNAICSMCVLGGSCLGGWVLGALVVCDLRPLLHVNPASPQVAWFDTDLSTKPYKILRNHKLAVRAVSDEHFDLHTMHVLGHAICGVSVAHTKHFILQVSYHQRYPMFATCSDDCDIHVFHGMVYNDLAQNPLIVPVKILKGHKESGGIGVMDCEFHPTQPWLLTCGADSSVRLYVP